ncbi:ABC transporter permease subunit [Streptomyces tsukubensis]|uniref:ABC transporter permease n=1 Tax=Streptomyces tsukubensis TaxID=83656 RepID=A0A1V3ZZT5_9ACTN|nr:ABC transporter permease subunit [Streptomyces tsukubensis]OON72005.1 ABC transporter permease [Streptomyces tsukubensis]QFR95753.1 ABC transporter permease subunit [Streptomyces tsukubensis]
MSTPPQQQPYAPHGQRGAPGGYTSPIPVTPANLRHALASEWTKIRSVRSTVWTLGVFFVLVVGIGMGMAALSSDAEYDRVPYTLPAFLGLVLGQICLIALGVLIVTSEYGTGLIRTTFTAAPQRHRVLTAKFLLFFVISFVATAFSITVVGLFTSTLHADTGEPWGSTVLSGALYVSLLGVVSLAVGSMLRHSAGAITTMLGAVLVPAVLPAFLTGTDFTRPLAEKLVEYNAPTSLAKQFGLGDGSGGAPQLLLLVGITVVAVAGAFLLLERRDV